MENLRQDENSEFILPLLQLHLYQVLHILQLLLLALYQPCNNLDCHTGKDLCCMLNIMNACLCSKLPCQNEVCWPLSACTPASLCSSIQSSLENNQPQHTSTTSVAMLMHAKTSNNAQQGSGRMSASSHRQLLALSGFSGTSSSRAQHNSATISCSERVHTIYTTTHSPYMHAHEYVHVGMHTMTCRDRCHWLSLPVTMNGNDYWLSEQPDTTIGCTSCVVDQSTPVRTLSYGSIAANLNAQHLSMLCRHLRSH